MIFGEGEDKGEISIKPVAPKEERTGGAGWSYTRDKAEPPVSGSPSGPAPVPAPPPGLFSAPTPPQAAQSPKRSATKLPGAGAPPPPPPPPSFDWAAPVASPPQPASDNAGTSGISGLNLPDLDNDLPALAGDPPPFLATPPGFGAGAPATTSSAPPGFGEPPTFGSSVPSESSSDPNQARTPLSKRPPARGRIHSDIHIQEHHSEQTAAPQPSASQPSPFAPSAPPQPVASPFAPSAAPPAVPSAPEKEPPSPFARPEAPEPGASPSPVIQPPPPPAPSTPPLPPPVPPAPEPKAPAKQEQRPRPEQRPLSQPQQRPQLSSQQRPTTSQRNQPDDKALPKPKSFGQIMPAAKKGPDQPSRPSDPGRHSAPQPAPGRNIFTVIGESDTVSPPEPKRAPFPDDSIMPGSGMQASEPPNWQNAQSSGTYRSGITPESPSAPQTSFDNLPTDDWKLDELDQRGENTDASNASQSPPSPFAPPGVAQPFTESFQSTEEKRKVIPFPDESAVFMPPQEELPMGTPGSAVEFGREPDSAFASPQAGFSDWEQTENSFSQPEVVSEQLEEPAPAPMEREVAEERSATVPNTKQFREACLASSTADSAMANDNYKVAMPLYKKAHKQFKKANATDSQEFGNCLHKLSDCYYHTEEYEEALAHYEEFIDWSKQRSTQPDILAVVVNLKRARTFQKLDKLDECDRAFHETVTMANRALPVSHPLFTVVYNSYISMLKFSGNFADKLKQVEEQFAERMMTSSRTVAIPEDLQDELSAWTDLEKADHERLERNRQLKLSRHMFQNERSRPGQIVHSITGSGAFKTIAIVVVSLLLIGSLTLMGFGAYMLLDQSGDKPTDTKDLVDPALGAYVGKVYKSADGLKTLTIKKDGTATFVFGNDSATFSALAGSPKEGITEDIRKMMFGKNNYIVEEVQKGFRDKDGTILYAEDSKNLKIVTEMQNIADLANYYYSRHQSQYPKKRKDFSEMGPDVKWENPLGQSIKPIIKAHEFEKYDGDVAFSENLDKYRKGKKIFEQDGKTGAPPGLIECLSIVPFDEYHTEDGVSFMVRAYDANGKFLTSSIPGEVFVVCQRNGVKHTVVKAEDLKSPVKDSSKTTAYFKLMTGGKN